MALKSLIILGAVLAVASGARSNFVQCVDTSLCPDGATCCETADGTWGCCPYEFGQCCQDGRHCCPLGYSCDAAQGSCVHELTQERLFRTALEPRVSGLAQNRRNEVIHGVNSVRCPDGNYCLDGQTCCLLTSGSFGCCPYQHAECCSDHTSCCPEGYRCRISTHQCVHATTNHTVAMAHKVSAVAAQPGQFEVSANDLFDENIRCPDGNYCEDGQTCCLLRSGQYGCCPYQYAQCCSDHVSCCPEGYLCKISTHQCIHTVTNHTVPMVQKVQPVRRPQGQASAPQVDAELNQCPDGSFCQDTQTCCLLKSGRYGCCPYAHAECCSDHTSCCPEGYRCLVSTQQCIHAESNGTAPMLRKVDSITLESTEQLRLKPDAVNNVRCPDGNYCLDGQTCCLLTSGSYGCCPYQHAECCSDHTSCCPEGYQCRISTHQCVHATTNHTMAMVQKVRAVATEPRQLEVSVNGRLIHCGDGSACFDNQTCCQLYDKSYDCCPYPRATCCEDQDSCCPEGYICIITLHKCKKASTGEMVPMHYPPTARRDSSKTVTEPSLPNAITCPDGHKCLNGQTCCPLSSGHYGCCPLPEAVCCSDHKTCCPNGYQCQVGTQTCQKGDNTVATLQKLPASTGAELIEVADTTESRTSALTSAQAELLKCPDGSYCQSTQTCCLLVSGHYGCCPYVQAQCCSDHTSCCPEGYRCKVSTKQCVHTTSNHSVAAGQKVDPVIPKSALVSPRPNDVTCPDGHKCQSGQTCCPLSSTRYGCCPLPDAVCCDDDQHCCPHGYICNEGSGSCEFGERSVPMVQKVAAFVDAALIQAAIPNEKCPDGNKCDDEQTCCQLRSGSYGCCPYHHAVCCDDKVHCCPEGYKCDAKADRCINGNLTASPMSRIIQKRISRPANRILVDVPNEKCPDGNKCDDEQTCCQLRSGSYGCCPYHHAVCCDDKVHCCPEGYKCNAKAERCINGNLNASSMSRIIQKHISRPANRILVDEVKRTCSDGSTCPDFATCCKSPNNTYSCCPFSVATCCADGYCCPRGFVCDEARHMCTLRRRPEDLPYLN
ncbi:progranulin isoform X17 [Rhipicephalus microplus]|uniref:progranulin isoform X17 n=1 Tax=Rhipicephalus microplus TaxID=6941 RepID=UPI003F6C7747